MIRVKNHVNILGDRAGLKTGVKIQVNELHQNPREYSGDKAGLKTGVKIQGQQAELKSLKIVKNVRLFPDDRIY